MNTIKILLIVIAFTFTANVCEAEESLDAKLARLETALKAHRSAQKADVAKIEKSTLKKTLAEELCEMKAHLETNKDGYDQMDERLSKLQRKLATLQAKLQSRRGGSSVAKKVIRVEAVSMSATGAQVVAAARGWNGFSIKPVASNFLSKDVLSLDGDSQAVSNFWNCASPTNGFLGLNDYLAPSGIEVGLGLTTVYQANVKGGTSTKERRGRNVGRYDAEMAFDLEKLLGIEGGSFFVHGWGGWPNEEGIDGTSVGSAWGVNALSVGNRTMDIVEAFYEGPFFSDDLNIAIGKLDFTGIFDASEYADDECGQFLNASLVDNPTIPFPAQGLGIVLNWSITDSWYLMGGAIDAQGDNRETGFRTAFHKDDYYFYALETGITAGNGTYRFGVWNDPQPKVNTDRGDNGKRNDRDDIGFYTSCDWLLYEENPDAEDSQGLGTFFRYGYAPSQNNDVTNFFSLGFQYQGLFDGRDDDVVGVAYSRGFFANTSATTYTEDYESVLEAYYNVQITPWFSLSPNVQYVSNPGGVKTAKDAILLGMRASITF